MAKKKRRKNCGSDNCLPHTLWPKLQKLLGSDASFYVDGHTGEVIVHTGLRALDNLELVPADPIHWYTVQCTCGNRGDARLDLLNSGKVYGCLNCMAAEAALKRN